MTGNNHIQIFQSDDGSVQLEIKLEQETRWLTQLQMSELFGTTLENVLMHLKNIVKHQERNKERTTKDFLVVRQEGKRQVNRPLKHPLADGNKRTGSFLFLWCLRINQHFLAKPIEALVNDNTLVALALLVAASKPEQNELIIRLV